MRYDDHGFLYGPEYWTIYDLGRPSDQCILPLPIRWPNSGRIVKRCPHCDIPFVLISAFEEDQPDGRESVFWANAYDDARMQAAWDERDRRNGMGHYRQHDYDYPHLDLGEHSKWLLPLEDNEYIDRRGEVDTIE